MMVISGLGQEPSGQHPESSHENHGRDENETKDDGTDDLKRAGGALHRIALPGGPQQVGQQSPAQPDHHSSDIHHPDSHSMAGALSSRAPTRSRKISSSVLPSSLPARRLSSDPCATSFPRVMTPTSLQRRSTISRMWEVRKTVRPRLTKECKRSLICLDATASIPSNGSSRNSRCGPGSRAAASASF